MTITRDQTATPSSAQQATWTLGDGPDWLGLIAVYSPAAAAAPAGLLMAGII